MMPLQQPSEVLWGFGLLASTLIFAGIDYHRTAAIDRERGARLSSFLLTFVAIGIILFFLARGVSWLRYLLALLVALSAIPIIQGKEPLNANLRLSKRGTLLYGAQTLTEIAALALLFTPAANEWFATA